VSRSTIALKVEPWVAVVAIVVALLAGWIMTRPTGHDVAANHESVTPSPVEAQGAGVGVREFTLVAQAVQWELAPGKRVQAWAYNGQVPGPTLRVREGDLVQVTFKNELPEPTTVHWHGIDVPNEMDGVPGVTQAAVQPGETFLYRFVAKPAGTRFYHTHGSKMGDEARQMDMGLSGPFIVEPRQDKPPYDREYALLLGAWMLADAGEQAMEHDMSTMQQEGSDGPAQGMEGMEPYNAFSINGKSWPATPPLVVRQGERVRLRLINVSTMSFHPMHLHGHQFKVVAADGNPIPEPAQLTKNTLTLMPGESYDIEFLADNRGVWLFHCHELHHADGGMATLVQYES